MTLSRSTTQPPPPHGPRLTHDLLVRFGQLAFRLALFADVISILAVFHLRRLAVFFALMFEKLVSVPLSVCLLLLFAIHESLVRLKTRSTLYDAVPYQKFDMLFWSTAEGGSLAIGDDFQSIVIRSSSSSSAATTTTTDLQSDDACQAGDVPIVVHEPPVAKTNTAAASVKKSSLLKAAWSVLGDSKEYRSVMGIYMSSSDDFRVKATADRPEDDRYSPRAIEATECANSIELLSVSK